MAEVGAGAVVAVVLCAGQGSRMGAGRNKLFLPLAGVPVLAWTLAAFERAASVDEVLLVAHPAEIAACEALARARGARRVRGVVAGGATRHQSEARALDALRPRIASGAIGVVLLHDGARPLVTPDEIERTIAAARESGAAILAAPFAPSETLLALATDGAVRGLVPTSDLARAQTPQAFDAALLLRAYDAAAAAGFEGTDTAASVERLGHAVRVVPGGQENLKITTPDDLARAEAILAARV